MTTDRQIDTEMDDQRTDGTDARTLVIDLHPALFDAGQQPDDEVGSSVTIELPTARCSIETVIDVLEREYDVRITDSQGHPISGRAIFLNGRRSTDIEESIDASDDVSIQFMPPFSGG